MANLDNIGVVGRILGEVAFLEVWVVWEGKDFVLVISFLGCGLVWVVEVVVIVVPFD
jgi:hypothetical protein